MEKTFGVICEGPSDYNVIKKIVEIYFKGEDVYLTCKQPEIHSSGKQKGTGGWSLVLEACKNNTIKDILDFNNYVIIQIDTDHSQDKPFDVPHVDNKGKIKSNNQLYKDIVEKISSLIIQPEIIAKKNNILFAICIHSTECWLLPILYTDNRKEHTNNCITALNIAINKKYKGKTILTKKNKNEDSGIKIYKKIMSEWKDKSDVENTSKHNIGFMNFIISLNNVNKI